MVQSGVLKKTRRDNEADPDSVARPSEITTEMTYPNSGMRSSEAEEARKKMPKFASGGTVKSGSPTMNMADGGTAGNPTSRIDTGFGRIIVQNEEDGSIAEAILRKRKMMANGGILSEGATDSDSSSQADLSRNAEEDQNHEDQLSFDALRKENYSESEGLSQLNQPMDSNRHGDEREERTSDKHDMVSQIRRKMRK